MMLSLRGLMVVTSCMGLGTTLALAAAAPNAPTNGAAATTLLRPALQKTASTRDGLRRLAESFDAGDAYSTPRGLQNLRRLAGAVALRAPEAAAATLVSQLTAVGGDLEGYAVEKTLPKGLLLLRLPPARRQDLALQSKADQRALQAVRRAAGRSVVNPVFVGPRSGSLLFTSGEILVRLKPGVDPVAYFGAAWPRVRRVPGTRFQYLLSMTDESSEAVFTEVSRRRADARVAWVEPILLGEIRKQFTPNDTYFSKQWGLENTGQGGGTADADVDATSAWNITRGTNRIVIAIVDDGIQTAHPDLQANIFANTNETMNGVDDDGNGYVDDTRGWNFYDGNNDANPSYTYDGHGTAVAGVAAAVGNNAKGVTGIAPLCRLLPVKVMGVDVEENIVSSYDMARAVRYASGVDDSGAPVWRGADVISISLGFPEEWSLWSLDEAFADAATFGRGGKGCIVLASTGNDASGWQAYELSQIPSGTHTYEWLYRKFSYQPAGDDTAWLDCVVFPDGSIERFEAEGLPAGWTSGGDVPWRHVRDGVDGNHAVTGWNGHGSGALRAGAIGPYETSSVQVTKRTGSGSVMFGAWVSSAEGSDSMLFLFDGEVVWDFETSGVPEIRNYIGYPASHPNVIAVGASTDFDFRSDYSQYDDDLDFVAPSSGGRSEVYTTDRTGFPGWANGDYTTDFGGTSASAPLAAGIAALLLSANPGLSQPEVREIMRRSCDKIGGVVYTNGFHPEYGYGRLNAERAVAQSLADLSVAGADASAPMWVGSNATYRIAVSNQGPAAASDVVIVVVPPKGFTNVDVLASSGAWIYGNGVVSGALDRLEVGASVTMDIVGRHTLSGSATNRATVRSSAGDTNAANNQVSITNRVQRWCGLTVASPHGTASPPEGDHAFADGTTQRCAVVDSPSPGDAGVQYECRGWRGTGSVPASGTTTSTPPFVLLSDSSVTWLWRTNYWLDTEKTGSGAVNVADSWQTAGTNIQITATASNHWHFSQWAGQTNGCTIASNKITVVMSGPRSVAAGFIVDEHKLTVTTPYGQASPPAGTNWLEYGSSTDVTITNTSESHGGTQHVCYGWSGSGSVPSRGTTTSAGTLTITNDSSITWLWQTNYWLEFETNGAGRLDWTAGWIRQGASATVTATGDAGWGLASWSGDTGLCSVAGATIRIPMDRPRRIVANFMEVGTVHFAPATYETPEAAASVVVSVVRDGDSSGGASVNYATRDGTALAGADYAVASGILSWTNGDTAAKSIVVPILNDSTWESNEWFAVRLWGAAGWTTAGDPTQAVVTIVSDDAANLATVQLDGPPSADEGSTNVYVATGIWEDGSQSNVTAQSTWRENSSYASMVAPGVLAVSNTLVADASCVLSATCGGKTGNKSIALRNTLAPDFRITGLWLSPHGSLVAGKPFSAYVTVRNEGGAAGNAGYLDVWMNQPAEVTGKAHGNKYVSVGTVAAGQQKTLVFTSLTAPISPGSNTFRAYVDSQAQTAETCETNNQATCTYAVRVLTNVVITSGPARIGEGAGAQYTCTAYFRDGTSEEVTADAAWKVSTLAAGISAGYLTAGTNLLADTACQITASYGGGTASRAVLLVNDLRPDFGIADIRLIPGGTVPCGKGFTALITVTNNGVVPGSGGYLDVWVDRPSEVTNKVHGSKYVSVGTLGTGQSKTFTLGGLPAPTARGPYVLRAFVDSQWQTVEEDETDNQATQVYVCKVLTNTAFTAGPTSVGEAETNQYVLTACWDDGSMEDVSPWAQWTESSPYAVSAAGGYLVTTNTLTVSSSSFTLGATFGGRTANQAVTVWNTIMPDFVITQFSTSPTEPFVAGAPFAAYVTVRNDGVVAGSAGYLDVWLDRPGEVTNKLRGTKYVSAGTLAAGQAKPLVISGLATPSSNGFYTLRAYVDSQMQTAEVDETNNQATLAYAVRSMTNLVVNGLPTGSESPRTSYTNTSFHSDGEVPRANGSRLCTGPGLRPAPRTPAR